MNNLQLLHSDVEADILKRVIPFLDGDSSASGDSCFTDLGLDSLVAVQIGIAMHNDNHTPFTVDMVEDNPTISQWAARIVRAAGQ